MGQATKDSMQDKHSYSFSVQKPSVARSTVRTSSLIIPVDPEIARAGDYFPAKLAISFGMAQFLCGVLIITFSAMSMVMEAAMSDIGAGLWAGTVVIVSGILGIMAGKRSTCTVYLVAFLCMAIISLAVSGLLVVFSAMGLIQDRNHPYGFYVDDQGNTVEFLGKIPLKSPAIAMNTVLIVLGIFSLFLSMGSVVICIREACQCYVLDPDVSGDENPGVDSMVRRNRIMSWLGDQQASESSVNFSIPRDDHKVHPTAMGVIPRIPACNKPASRKSSRDGKRNISPTVSSSTVKTEVEQDTGRNNYLTNKQFVHFARHISKDKSNGEK